MERHEVKSYSLQWPQLRDTESPEMDLCIFAADLEKGGCVLDPTELQKGEALSLGHAEGCACQQLAAPEWNQHCSWAEPGVGKHRWDVINIHGVAKEELCMLIR